ncbi:MAG: hypothetical protein QOE48_4700 [Mycobacterium sp.]|jgi:hypothetical protein|nr:hypothetical protein [Mycobacterium sp.]
MYSASAMASCGQRRASVAADYDSPEKVWQVLFETEPWLLGANLAAKSLPRSSGAVSISTCSRATFSSRFNGAS